MVPKKNKRKKPLSSASSLVTVSHKATQATISTFHTLLRERSLLLRQCSRSQLGPDRDGILKDIDAVNKKIEEIGGLEAYQQASILGQSSERGGDSSKVLIDWLKTLRNASALNSAPKQRMLEIGALTPDNYASCSSWIENHPIDLHSQHPKIAEQDFLLSLEPASDAQKFDIISCSLVLNFVADAKDRGRMLELCRLHLRSQITSLLFIVLPLPCLTNSRYMTIDSFKELMTALGFKFVNERWKPQGKVIYSLWQWSDRVEADLQLWNSKKEVNPGQRRNNFTILV